MVNKKIDNNQDDECLEYLGPFYNHLGKACRVFDESNNISSKKYHNLAIEVYKKARDVDGGKGVSSQMIGPLKIASECLGFELRLEDKLK